MFDVVVFVMMGKSTVLGVNRYDINSAKVIG